MRHPTTHSRVRPGFGAALGLCFGLCLGPFVGPRVAAANGRFPTAQHVVVGPGAGREALALRTTFGVLTSLDGGRGWQWRCEEMLGYSYTAVWDPPVALGLSPAGPRLLVGLTDGLVGSPDGCTAAPVSALSGRFAGDLTTSPDGRTVYFVSSDNRPNGLFVSRDGGETFAAYGATVEGVFFETVEVAPSDPLRLYLTGVTRAEPQRAVVYRSDDGGLTLRPLDWPGPPVERLFVSGIDPRDPDVCYLRATLPASTATALLRVTQAGAAVEEIARVDDAMRGFALSDDGRRVFVGSPEAGLMRSVDRGPFVPRGSYRVQCLRFHAGGLYVCGDERVDGFALGRSEDDGATALPLLRLGDVLPRPVCGPGSTWSQRCEVLWPLLQSTLRPLRDGGPDTGPVGSLDAAGARDAPGGAPPPTGRGCGCRVVQGSPGGRPSVLGLGLLGALVRRRRVHRGPQVC